jgi:hypothetical protein
MNARSEPLLWLQLIAVGVLPLEALLLLLLLAGSDPGPVPGLERLLCWGLGGLVPAVVLWRRPADVWSLLLLQIPLRARRPLQQRLSSLQESAALRIGLVAGSALLLALLWWSDEHAAIAGPFSPLAASPRLVGLLLAALLLALMLWQWQQLLQSLWLLSRSSDTLAAAEAMTSRELEARRLCLGLPLLLLDPLVDGTASRPRAETGTEPAVEKTGPLEPAAAEARDSGLLEPKAAGTTAHNHEEHLSAAAVDAAGKDNQDNRPGDPTAANPPKQGTPQLLSPEASTEEFDGAVTGSAAGAPAENGPESGPAQPGPSAAVPVAIEPEQRTEDGEGGDLDQQVG